MVARLVDEGTPVDHVHALTISLRKANFVTSTGGNRTPLTTGFTGWPVERLVPALAALVVGGGLLLGETRSSYWRLLSAFAAANLALYAAVGWCPASLLMQRIGVRSLRRLDTNG